MQIFQSKILFICLLISLSACNFKEHYTITVKFDKADGLYVNNEVRISGLKVGYVRDTPIP
jgi:ABC-type transporter Mla subunit MlaD